MPKAKKPRNFVKAAKNNPRFLFPLTHVKSPAALKKQLAGRVKKDTVLTPPNLPARYYHGKDLKSIRPPTVASVFVSTTNATSAPTETTSPVTAEPVLVMNAIGLKISAPEFLNQGNKEDETNPLAPLVPITVKAEPITAKAIPIPEAALVTPMVVNPFDPLVPITGKAIPEATLATPMVLKKTPSNKWVTYQSNQILQSPDDGILARSFKGVISIELLDQLEQLIIGVNLLKNWKDGRGERQGCALGVYNIRGHYDIVPTKTAKTEAGQIVEAHIKKISLEAKSHLYRALKNLYKAYSVVKKEHRPFDPFSTVMVNGEPIKKIHKDGKDYRDGLCLVIPFGNFSGGNLMFPSYKREFVLDKGNNVISISLFKGDMIIFKSHTLHHGNNEVYWGERRSLVFFTHNSVITSNMKEILDPTEEEETSS